jgi:hypothetical protein
VSLLRRLFGGSETGEAARADDADTEEAPGGEEELPVSADDELSEDLKAFLYPQDEFILRQQRYSRYKWEPPPNEPQREPRLQAMGELIARTRQPTDEQVAAVTKAYKRRPSGFDRELAALRDQAQAAGREADLSAARDPRLGDPREPDSEPDLPDDFRSALVAAAQAVAVRDLLEPRQVELLTGPWRAGFGELPAETPARG